MLKKKGISKNLLQMILLFLGVICVLLSVFFGVIYYQGNQMITDSFYEKNLEHLALSDASMKNIDEQVKRYMLQTIEAPYLLPLFSPEVPKSSTEILIRRELSESIFWDSSIYSVSIYNGMTDRFYSSRGYAEEDLFLRESVEHYQNIVPMQPTIRTLPVDAYFDDRVVLTYVYFQTGNYGNLHRAIIVNVDASYLLNSVLRLKPNGDYAFLYDSSNETIISRSGKAQASEELSEDLLYRIQNQNLHPESFHDEKNSKVYSFLKSSFADWVWVVVESDAVLVQIKYAFLGVLSTVTVLALLGGGLLIMMISRRVYHPIEELVFDVLSSDENINTSLLRDDIAVLSDWIGENRKQILAFEDYKMSAEGLLQENYVQSVLQDESSQLVKFSKLFQNEYDIIFDNLACPILFRINHYHTFSSLPKKTYKAFQYAIMNLAEEILNPTGECLSIFMGEGVIVVFVFMTEEKQNTDWENLVKRVQENVKYCMDFSLLACIGDYALGREEFIEQYNRGTEILALSPLFEREEIINLSTSDIDERPLRQSVVKEKELLLYASQGEDQKAAELFNQLIVSYASFYNLASYRERLLHIFLERQLQIQAKAGKSNESIDRHEVFRQIVVIESLEDARNYWKEINLSTQEIETLDMNPHGPIIESVKAYIEEHYSQDITLNSIAEHYRISPGYLGSIFRNSEGIGVADYIGNTRLQKAERLICNTTLPIVDVIDRTGFNNESGFYRFFKREYGTTPGNYRKQHIVNGTNNTID